MPRSPGAGGWLTPEHYQVSVVGEGLPLVLPKVALPDEFQSLKNPP
jgi:hypothetical protein